VITIARFVVKHLRAARVPGDPARPALPGGLAAGGADAATTGAIVDMLGQ
jgi:hypothetical protein